MNKWKGKEGSKLNNNSKLINNPKVKWKELKK